MAQTLSRHLLRRHLVPFGVAFAGLTSLMLLNQVAKRLPDLVGSGVPSGLVAQIFVFSVPFIIAMTVPMAVLVAVLWVFTRRPLDGEIAAMRNGHGARRFITPLLAGAACVAALSLVWNDQVVPRSNHRLRTLLAEIAGATPTEQATASLGDREMTIGALGRAATSAREEADRAAANGRETVERIARQHAANYEVEIQKKYALAAASLVFVLLAVSVGLRFPGKGVGVVIVATFAVATLYYVGLIMGESLGNRLIVSPFLAMWAPNLLLGVVALVALSLSRKPTLLPG